MNKSTSYFEIQLSFAHRQEKRREKRLQRDVIKLDVNMNMKKSLTLSMIVALLTLVGCGSQSVKGNSTIDLASITSTDQAKALFEQGKIDRVYLMPLDFGGIEASINILYIPKKQADEKRKIDQEIYELAVDGLIKNYEANPTYQGDSFVPTSIEIKATGKQTYIRVINIY